MLLQRRRAAAACAVVLGICEVPAVAQTRPNQVPATTQTVSTTQTAPPAQPGSTPEAAGPAQTAATDIPPPAPRRRGNGALFGASDTTTRRRTHMLDVTVSAGGAYDDDISEGQSLSSPFDARMGGEYSDLGTTLAFARNGSRVQIAGEGATSLRHYPSLNSFVGSSYSAGTDVTIEMSRRTTLRGNFEGSYVSTFALDTLSRQSTLNPATTPTEFAATSLDWTRMSYGGTVALTRLAGRHSSFSLTSGVRTSERSLIVERAMVRSVGTQYARALGRDTSLWIDYNFRDGTQAFTGESHPVTGHDVQVGIERRWRHAAGRRTAFSLAAGPSVLHESPAIVRQVDRLRVVPLVGTVSLNHEMSRSWNVGMSFRRAAGFIDAGMSDTATVDVRGLVSRRVELVGTAGYSDVDLVLDAHENRYGTIFGSTRVQVAMTRALALYGQYTLYYYDFGTGVTLPRNVAAQIRRNSFRAGLTLWMPLHGGK